MLNTITHNIERCRKMIPTKGQWQKWSLPSKLTAIGAYVGILGVILTVIFFFVPYVFHTNSSKKELHNSTTYQYRLFNTEAIDKSSLNKEEIRNFLNNLDNWKRKADESLENIIKESKRPLDLIRLRRINDYVFRVYRDFWFIQQTWKDTHDRYFQGKTTTPNPPDYMKDGAIKLNFGLGDQVDDWRDIGYNEEYAPVQLECHVYEGPSGHGFTIWARIQISSTTWQNQMHFGPEKYRDKNNFIWISN